MNQAPVGLGHTVSVPCAVLWAFRDLTIACTIWAGKSDACLIHMPTEEIDRAYEVLTPYFGGEA